MLASSKKTNSATAKSITSGDLKGYSGSVKNLTALPNGQLLVVSGKDDTMRIWDLDNHVCIRTLIVRGSTTALRNGILVSSSGNEIKVWNIASEACVGTLTGHSDTVNSLVFLPNGQLASGSKDKSIKIWDMETFLCVGTVRRAHSAEVNCLAVLSNGQLSSGSSSGSVKVWNIFPGHIWGVRAYSAHIFKEHRDGIVSLVGLPNGLLASGSYDRSIKVWDISTGACVGPLSGVTGVVKSLVFLPNGLLAGVEHENTAIKVWRIMDGRCLGTIDGHNKAVTSLVVLANGQLVSGSEDQLKIWPLDLQLVIRPVLQPVVASSPPRKSKGPLRDNIDDLLHSNSAKTRQNATDALNMLIPSEETSSPIAEVALIQELVQLLDDLDIETRQIVAKGLRNFAMNEANKRTIVQAGAIPPLVRLLRDNSPLVRQFTAGALQNLAMDNAENQIAIATAGAISPLLASLGDANIGVRKRAIMALLNLSGNATNRTFFVKAEARSCLESRLLKENDTDIKMHIQAVLDGYSSRVESQKKPVLREETPPYSISPTLPGGLAVIPSRELQIQRELGRGGFGVVSEALWQGSTKVALKQLSSQYLPETMLAEFQQEADIHGRLRHPNIVILYGVCLEHMKYALVMELMVKGSLFGVLDSVVVLPWSTRIQIALDAVVGLFFLHERSIVHRDLKSMNILLDGNGVAKLADFGLAKVKNATATTTTGSVGTLYWMAPELFRMNGQCSQATDIYAMGMVLWELAARKLPYQSAAGNQALVMEWVKGGEREDIPNTTPPGIARLITQCWAARPESRPTSARVMIDALKAEQGLSETAAAGSGYQQFSLR